MSAPPAGRLGRGTPPADWNGALVSTLCIAALVAATVRDLE
jgi:hypothetical protein